jgi:hypothetical protein
MNYLQENSPRIEIDRRPQVVDLSPRDLNLSKSL